VPRGLAAGRRQVGRPLVGAGPGAPDPGADLSLYDHPRSLRPLSTPATPSSRSACRSRRPSGSTWWSAIARPVRSSGSTGWISDRDIQGRYLCGWREFDDLVSPLPLGSSPIASQARETLRRVKAVVSFGHSTQRGEIGNGQGGPPATRPRPTPARSASRSGERSGGPGCCYLVFCA
jgi:hypothetical protein